jgi:hypothetical protein
VQWVKKQPRMYSPNFGTIFLYPLGKLIKVNKIVFWSKISFLNIPAMKKKITFAPRSPLGKRDRNCDFGFIEIFRRLSLRAF